MPILAPFYCKLLRVVATFDFQETPGVEILRCRDGAELDSLVVIRKHTAIDGEFKCTQ